MENAHFERICREIDSDRQYIIDLRRYFHSHPELSAKEYGTAEKIERELDIIGLPHTRVGETGVFAEIKGNDDGKIIVLRADTDALPVNEEHECAYKSQNAGVMHACGHDAHTAALIGAARVLSKNRDLFFGTVRLCFQQGEEIGYGARLFVDGGYLDGGTRTFGVHLASYIDVGKVSVTPGPNNASVDWFKITVHGVGAHISEPQNGVDAAYIISKISAKAKELCKKTASPVDDILVGIGKITAGTAYNVIADKAVAEGTVRVYSPKVRQKVQKKINDIANSTAEKYGGRADIEWRDFTSPLINDEKASSDMQKCTAALFGKENVITDLAPRLAGDDFAEFVIKVPGTYAYVGSRNKDVPETCVSHHNSHFDIDERCIDIAVKLYVFSALDHLK
ncbi:MAG: amidohydrolase [Clostridia bacterium]|nr:amidohydrolase [Clostridia bacterium]